MLDVNMFCHLKETIMLNNFIQFKGVVSGEIEYQIINLDVYILISY